MIQLFNTGVFTIYDKSIYDTYVTATSDSEKKKILAYIRRNKRYCILKDDRTMFFNEIFRLRIKEGVYQSGSKVIISLKKNFKKSLLYDDTPIKDYYLCSGTNFISNAEDRTLITEDITKFIEERDRVEKENFFKKYMTEQKDAVLKSTKDSILKQMDAVMSDLFLSLDDHLAQMILEDERININGIIINDIEYHKEDIYGFIISEQKNVATFYKFVKAGDIDAVLDFIVQGLKK